MDTKELNKKTKESVQEISMKLTELKNKLSQNKNPIIDAKVKTAIDKLEDLNQEIKSQHELLVTARDQSESKKSEMEKNIYNSIESFNNAYTKAGSLFNTH